MNTSPITYSKSDDEYYVLGNMCRQMPLFVNNRKYYAAEHLYLCGEWSNDSERHRKIQEYICKMTSGDYAKRCSKSKQEFREAIREDFPTFRLDWMLWVVWQKAQTHKRYRDCLLSTGYRQIIEVEKPDPFWAAYPDENGVYVGENHMGQINMLIRDCLRNGTEPPINRDLLNSARIFLFGEQLKF